MNRKSDTILSECAITWYSTIYTWSQKEETHIWCWYELNNYLYTGSHWVTSDPLIGQCYGVTSMMQTFSRKNSKLITDCAMPVRIFEYGGWCWLPVKVALAPVLTAIRSSSRWDTRGTGESKAELDFLSLFQIFLICKYH